MNKINDGGPAYPHARVFPDTSGRLENGLSKREVFAMAAMQELIAVCLHDLTPQEIAHEALVHADALIVELAKELGQ